MQTLDNFFDDKNRELREKLEAGNYGVLQSMRERNLGKSELNAISTNRQYRSPFMDKNGIATGASLVSSKEISVFDYTGDDEEGKPGYVYHVKTIACDDGAKVYSNYQSNKPGPGKLYLFYENEQPGRSNLFGNFCIASMGDSFKGIIDNFLKYPGKPIIKTDIDTIEIKDYATLTQYVNSLAHISSKHTLDFNTTFNAIEREYNSKTDAGKLYSDLCSIDEMVARGINWCADGLGKLLITEAGYIPSPSQKDAGLDKTLFEGFVKSELVQDLESVLNKAYSNIEKALTIIARKIMASLPEPLKKVIGKIQELVKWLQNGLSTVIEAIQLFVQKFAAIIAEILLLVKAFLCGIVNGIIGTVQAILRILAFLIDMSGTDSDYQGYLRRRDFGEKVESVLDFVYDSFTSLIGGIKDLFTQSEDVTADDIADFFTTIGGFLKKQVEDFWNNTSRYQLAYWTGIFIFEIIINVLLALTTAGTANVLRAGTYAEKLAAFSKLWVREAFSVATLGVVDLLTFFKSIITAFVKACSKGLKGLIRWVKALIEGIKKSKGGEELLADAEKTVGMAENIPTRINVEEFLASAKKLENIKPEDALKYLDEALVHFNHEVIDGVVVQIGDENCAIVVQRVEEYLKTGKISKAIPSEAWDFKVVENLYDRTGLSLDNISSLKNLVKDGERGIVGCWKANGKGHVVNFIKENGAIKFVDGQIGKSVTFTPDYILFKYFRIIKK